MAEQRDALTELVRGRVGTHTGPGKMSVAAFVEKAVDPESGYRPSNGLVGKIVAGLGYTVTPQLVSALAEGLGLPRDVVAAAAHFQVIGFAEVELESGAPATLLAQLDRNSSDLSKSRAVAARWEAEESGGVRSVDIRDTEG